MNSIHSLYLAVFCAGVVATLLTTPLAQMLARRLDIMDRPKSEAHKGHAKATPLLGGLAVFCGWLGCLAGALLLIQNGAAGRFAPLLSRYIPGILHVSPQLAFLVFGGLLCVLLGLADDKFGMKAYVKFAGQFVIAVVAVLLGGVRISIFISNPVVTAAVTIFWFMLLMNSINFFDNMDGLAVGTITIAMFFFGTVAALKGQFFVASFAFLFCGNCAGFWFYNHSPASIFMGDSGSHFLGYLTAVVSASVSYFSIDSSLSRFPILVPLFILAVPLFDTMMVVLIRWRNHKPFWIGDQNHISHRFVKIGLSRKQSVMAVHLLVLITGLGAFPVIWGTFRIAAIVVAQMLLVFLLVSILQFVLSGREMKK